MPAFLKGINRLSPMSWGAYILTNITFQDTTFTCSSDEVKADGSCYFATGDEVLALYDYDGGDGKYGMTFNYFMLAIVTMIYILLALISVRLRALKLSH
jgi:ABC-type multidrug transport system permease subunit